MDVPETDEEIFLKTLDEKELMAYHIAKSHLGSLFSLDKSNAYLEWKAKLLKELVDKGEVANAL